MSLLSNFLCACLDVYCPRRIFNNEQTIFFFRDMYPSKLQIATYFCHETVILIPPYLIFYYLKSVKRQVPGKFSS
jgi:hypothetical protein